MVRVGNMLAMLGEREEALGYYRRAQAIFADEVEADPRNTWKRAGLIEIHAFTCAALAGLAQHAAASAACDEAVVLIDETSVEPTNAVIRASLARSYKAMADGYIGISADRRSSHRQQLHYARAAHGMYQKSVAIWSDMAVRGMLTSSDDEEAAAVAGSLQNAEVALRNLTAGR
jgi:tetratricopeptide (TPR) repeat protein